MPRLRDNITAHELVGTEIEVKRSSDSSLAGLTGIIRDETRNTLSVDAGSRVKLIPKSGSEFELRLHGESIIVNGDELVLRPEDRVKRRLQRRA